MIIKRETKPTLDRLKKEECFIKQHLETIEELIIELQDAIKVLPWYFDGFYRAAQYAEMADNTLDSVSDWLEKAEKELKRWKDDHEA